MVAMVKVGWNYEFKSLSTDKTITIAIVIVFNLSILKVVTR